MSQKRTQLQSILRVGRRYWLLAVSVGFALLLWCAELPAQAAPLAQTVPTATDEPTATPVPPATNTPQPNDNDDDDEEQPTPTPPSAATEPPPPAATQPPAQPGQGGLTGLIIAGSRLNMREGPGTNFAVIGGVNRDEVVQVLERNAENTWWRICCSTSTSTEGWASVQFIQPNFDAAQSATLIPVVAGESAASPAPATSNLTLTLAQFPQYVWQGQTVSIRLVVANTGTADATNIEVRDELSSTLTFGAVEVDAGGQWEQQTGNEGRVVVSVRWPTLAAGQSVAATIQVQVADDLPDGSVIDNLAVLSADTLAPTTEGLSIGMPPVNLPDFQ